jgi:L-fucose mutarotase
MEAVHKHHPAALPPQRLERHAFYQRARTAFAVVMTGELRKYGNLLLKKGVTPVA